MTNSSFLTILNAYFTMYLPNAKGVSSNTILSYKTTFRLLLQYILQTRNIHADRITFDMLDYEFLTDFLSWIENERKCCPATKNLRLSAISSFSAYAQKNVEITGYRPISVCVVGGASTFCGAVGIVSDNAIKLASNEETTVMVRVIYELK